ncbi:MAG: NFACT RNA binding domain-containing protein [Cyclobacteriaceae bacterium]
MKRLVAEMQDKLIGKSLETCFSQSKDEMILGFADAQSEFYIKTSLESKIGLLYFSNDFKRARKNSIDLFPSLLTAKCIGVYVYQFERSFRVEFENDQQLVFKMHGSRSNILLTEKNTIVSLFRNNLPQDKEIVPSELNKAEATQQKFIDTEGNLQSFLPALGKEIKRHLEARGYNDLAMDDRWHLVEHTLHALEENPITVSENEEGIYELSLLYEQNSTLWQTTSAIEAANAFYTNYTKNVYLNHRKQDLLKELNKKIKQSESYLKKTRSQLQEIKSRRGQEEIANIIMANLHQIKQGDDEVVLDDFYNGSKIKVKLKPSLTPQKNAESLYRKAKNLKLQLQNLEENIRAKEDNLSTLLHEKKTILETTDFRELRNKDKESKKSRSIDSSHLPYHYYTFKEYDVLVGKNAKSNDELTTKIANKNDYWLHAKDVSGSHVIIRNSTGKTIPADVLEWAAQLAAWFSKRKTDSLCPVIYTERKYVRKIKGTPAGLVKVEKESVIMVEPSKH